MFLLFITEIGGSSRREKSTDVKTDLVPWCWLEAPVEVKYLVDYACLFSDVLS